MKNQRRWVGLLAVAVVLGAVSAAGAAEKATKEECVAKVKEAAQLIQEVGPQKALARLSAKDGGFVWKDSYVFALNADTAAVAAHPIKPKLVGKMLTGMKDINGKLFFAEFLNTAKEKGEGWVEYMWPKPGEKTPSPKVTYVYKVPGESLVVLAGVYK